MTRRAWLVILPVAVCVTTVSGCAQTTQNLLNCHCWQEDQAVVKQTHNGLYPAEESEISPPPRPAGEDQLAPGRRVPEYLKPPPVLLPRQLTVPTLPMRSDFQPALQAPVPEKSADEHRLVSALRMLLARQPDKALPYLEQYDRATQEMLLGLLPALVLLDEKSIDHLSPAEAGKLQDQLQGVLGPVRARTELTINKLCLCEKTYDFGQVTPKRDGNIFQAGDMMLVYLEVCNTTCQLRDGYYVTNINGTASIRDQSGQEWWLHDYRMQETPLKSILPRYDCWRPYGVNLPSVMPPGKYILTMEVTDKTLPAWRTARKSVEFVVK